MVIRGMPALAVTLEPLYNSQQDVTSLVVSVRCDGYSVQAQQPFLSMRKKEANLDLPTYNDDTNRIKASDDEGDLPLQKDSDADALVQIWRASRA